MAAQRARPILLNERFLVYLTENDCALMPPQYLRELRTLLGPHAYAQYPGSTQRGGVCVCGNIKLLDNKQIYRFPAPLCWHIFFVQKLRSSPSLS